MDVVEALVVVLGAVATVLIALAMRRRVLLRGAGAIDMSLRQRFGRAGRGWALGVGRYAGDYLQWFRVFAFTPRPARVLCRHDLEVTGQRFPQGAESWSVQSGAVVVECLDGEMPVQLAMTAEALTGFLSWLESAPPGYQVSGYAAS